MGDYEKMLDNIRSIINDKGMKHSVVAERAGFTPQEFSNMMNGRKTLRAEYIPDIAKAMRVDPNTVYFYEEYKREEKVG